MNKENIELVIKDIENTPNIEFDMKHWGRVLSHGDAGHPCKTAACIAGFAVNRHYPKVYCEVAELVTKASKGLLTPEESSRNWEFNELMVQLGSEILGLSEEEAWELFDPENSFNLFYLDDDGCTSNMYNSNITKEEALTVLRNLIETGEIDWTKGTRYFTD